MSDSQKYLARNWFNTLGPKQNRRHFPDDSFKCIFLTGYVWISIKISLKFLPKGPINNILALVQIMAWRRPGDKPLSEPMMDILLTHICVTRPQWVKTSFFKRQYYFLWFHVFLCRSNHCTHIFCIVIYCFVELYDHSATLVQWQAYFIPLVFVTPILPFWHRITISFCCTDERNLLVF